MALALWVQSRHHPGTAGMLLAVALDLGSSFFTQPTKSCAKLSVRISQFCQNTSPQSQASQALEALKTDSMSPTRGSLAMCVHHFSCFKQRRTLSSELPAATAWQ